MTFLHPLTLLDIITDWQLSYMKKLWWTTDKLSYTQTWLTWLVCVVKFPLRMSKFGPTKLFNFNNCKWLELKTVDFAVRKTQDESVLQERRVKTVTPKVSSRLETQDVVWNSVYHTSVPWWNGMSNHMVCVVLSFPNFGRLNLRQQCLQICIISFFFLSVCHSMSNFFSFALNIFLSFLF